MPRLGADLERRRATSREATPPVLWRPQVLRARSRHPDHLQAVGEVRARVARTGRVAVPRLVVARTTARRNHAALADRLVAGLRVGRVAGHDRLRPESDHRVAGALLAVLEGHALLRGA